MSMFCQPVKVLKYWHRCIVLMLLLLMAMKGNTQWAIEGPRTITVNETYSYVPTYGGSTVYPYCGSYTWRVTGGYFTTLAPGKTTYRGQSDCPVASLYDLEIVVKWTSSTGTLTCLTEDLASISVAGLSPGTISPSSQYINFNTAPAPITGTAATGYSSSCIVYQWQKSTDNLNWTNIPVTTQNYTPGASDVLTTTTWFRRMVSCDGSIDYSNVVSVGVYPQLTSSISPFVQNIAAGGTAATLTSTVVGGSGTYTYQWQSSPNNSTWTNVATTATYSPGVINTTTYYRLIVTSNGASVTSNTATVTAYSPLTCSIGPSSQNVNAGSSAATLTSTVSGGLGTYTYQWQSSPNNSTWTNVATTATYSPGVINTITYYRLIVTSNGTSVTSNTATVTVNSALACSIGPSSQSVNTGSSAATLTSTVSGGSGTYTYQWQSSANNSTWTNTATTATYSPGVINTTTYYRLIVTSNGASVTSNTATVTVYPALTCSISPSVQNIYSGGTVATLTPTVGGGSGTYTYQWQTSVNRGDTWSNVATTATYNPGAVSIATTYVRLIVNSNGVSVTSNTATINTCAITTGSLTGADTCMAGFNIKLNSAFPAGGQWTSGNTAVANVDANGVVYGEAAGNATISYTYTNPSGCGKYVAKSVITVIPFNSYVQGLGNGIDDPVIIDTLSLAQNTVETLEFKQDTGRSLAHSIRNVLALRVIEETTKYIPGDFSATAVLKVEYGHSSAQIYQVDSIKLTVNYTAGATNKYNALNYFTFKNAEFVRVTVLRVAAPTTVNGTSFETKQVLLLTNNLAGTRYYQLSDNKRPVLTYTSPATSPRPDALPVSWTLPAYTYNNAVQLEWAWLEDQMQSSYVTNNVFDTALLFRTGATRIDLPGAVAAGGYSIPLLYDGTGKLYMRLRAANMMPNGSRSDGPWSWVKTYAFSGHNDSLNWQSTTTYAEDGKRKTVIQYYDGSLRARQTVTKDNTTGQTIVAETMYDMEGRPAVQILPAPGINNIIAYNKNLNKFNGQNDNTNPADFFDLTTTALGNYGTTPLNDSFGTAKYYSARNADAGAGYHKNIPVANGYAYAVTRYMPDGTGRVMRQSGAGDSLKMGSGHEMRYYYGTPAQEELDALFGTEVGNYTHYFKNMVRDANGQMSISYVDMHSRTIATALAGEATPNLQALAISDTNVYKNQAGATYTRNLLTKESNTVKGNSIESISTILAPVSNTNYAFTYKLNKQTVTLPTCTGGTVSYDCKFDLQITVTDESGDSNPFVYTYTGIDAINFSQTIALSAGSYSVRKTLTINQDSLALFLGGYNTNGVGLCTTQQTLINNIVNEDLAASGCDTTAASLNSSSCLATLGNYNTYLSNYATGIGKTVSQLTPEQVNDIRSQYRNDSAFCASLNRNRSQTLEIIRQQMLSDMVPYSGQYASDAGAGTMYNKYNIFSTTNTTKQPYYKYPKNETGGNNYYTAVGNIDASVPASRLQTMTKETFESEFAQSWATSLLPYHPEFAKLKFAEDSLRSSFNFIDSIQLLTIPIEPVNSDPFFTIAAQKANKDSIIKYSTVGYPAAGAYSMWQIAYGEAFGCKTLNASQRNFCYNAMPKQLTATGTTINPGTGVVTLTTAMQTQAWNMYMGMYAQVRGNMLNQYINLKPNVTDTTDNRALFTQGYRIYFPYNDVQAAQSSGWASWYPNDQGSIPTVNLKDSVALYGSHCDSYINAWRQALLNCPALAAKDTTTREAILNTITGRMLQVCKYGTDGANPYGSSTVAPAYRSAGDTSFEQIVTSVFSINGISISAYCHPYGIQWPVPYGNNPVITKQSIGAVDTCTCSQWAKLKTQINLAGYNANSLAGVNQYLSSKYRDTITAVLYNGLLQCGVPYLYNCKDTVSNPTVRVSYQKCDTMYSWPLASVQPRPVFLNCGFDSSSYRCYSCSEFVNLDALFFAIFKKHPVFTGVVPDSMIVWNNLFAQYVNFKTGLQRNWLYYATQFNATKCAIGGISGTPTALSICLERTPLNDTTGLGQALSPCQAVRTRATLKAMVQYEYLQQKAIAAFNTAYRAKCISATESFAVKYALKEYHYTLYYYDQPGNLIKTVPPKGVRPNNDSTFLSIVKTERQKMENGSTYSVTVPQHSLVTRYCFNSLNKVVLQKSPDGGKSSFWYDRLGRLTLSQNARQVGQAQGKVYSYTKYDSLSRITEVGEITSGSVITDAVAKNETSLQSWYTTANNGRTQVTQTIYDIGYAAFTGSVRPVWQQNLRNRVSYMLLWNKTTDTYAASGTYYTYDIHGNVDTLLQDFGNSAGTGNPMNLNQSGNRFKKIVYDYDLVSGKVNQVSYQPGQADAYYQQYRYDAENRLTDVYSGRDSVMLLLFPEREAHYDYYKHGPLARTTLAQLLVQKLDYAYTLQGWLKGVNPAMGGTLTNGTDTTEAYPVAQDVFGFSLHYFKNDYKAIGYTPQSSSVLGALGNNAASLFNGNIAAMAVNIPKLGANNVYNYRYDQLNRLVSMDVYKGLNAQAGTFTPVNISDYRERASYDPNGNILTYTRYGDAARTGPMDSLKYFYKANTNQLHKVVDTAADASAANYSKYNDIKKGQTDNNYQYDEIGNLIKDNIEGLTNVTWNVYGKIASITKSAGVTRYLYNSGGQRIMTQTPTDTTIYVRDASGNVMSVYRKPAGGSLVQTEMHLYGSSRLGMATQHVAPDTAVVLSGGFAGGIKSIFTRGEKLFELTNHLSNVLATVSDRRMQHNSSGTVDYYLADVMSANDYYPFGMLMPGRKYTANSSYRFGAGAQENVDEVSGFGNHYTALFWEMDPRLGRRWNLDPKYTGSESRYAVNGNNPIIYVDPLGDFKTKFGAWVYKVGHGGEIGRDTKSGQYYVGKQVEDTGEGFGVTFQRRFDWNGGNAPYTGSGWGHNVRSLAANIFGVNGQASSLFDLGWNSVLQNRSVQLTGDLLNKVKQDPDVIRYENWIVTQLHGKGEGTYSFESSQVPKEAGGGIQLGGERGSLNPLDPNSAATWQVAANPLTWAVRSVNIKAQVHVNAEGCMSITYQFTDNFDLRPETGGKVYFGGSGNSPFSSGSGKRPWQYNAATSILGVPYHDIVGGNDQLKIKATWQSNR